MKIAVLGGGIAGLAATYHLKKQYPEATLHLLEASNRFGGKIISRQLGDCLMEGGPDSLLTEKPWALDLCRELGMGDQLLGSNDAHRSFSILRDGVRHPFPTGCKLFIPQKIGPVVTSPLLSLRAKLAMAQEPFRRFQGPEGDESLADFVTRHFGDEVLQRLAGPLLGGIYGGDPETMSMAATFPRLREMEQTHGSLVRGMRQAMKKMEQARVQHPQRKTPSLFTSLWDGMASLTDRLAAECADSLFPNTPVEHLAKTDHGWEVNGEAFEHCVCALPARRAAPLFAKVCPELRDCLAQQQTSSSATLSLVFEKRDLGRAVPQGFGFMSAHPIPGTLVGCTWTGNKFKNRTGSRRFACRAFLGGPEGESRIKDEPDSELIRGALDQLRATCPFIPEAPVDAWLQRWPDSNPQYAVGHLDWVNRIHAEAASLGHLHFVGSSYDGVSVSDCVRQAQNLCLSEPLPNA